ncbi:DNA recombination protein RmuC [Dyadobacter sp. 3J3]|uniref:DNA recombination protein RmuC n=1 Tax=Dyadobacter sp. 3J3 TaxID=2606600 RepID=UPI00190F6D6A|nr:DNA recombination protein RmuC [Dyadobacter sp. 3J3]
MPLTEILLIVGLVSSIFLNLILFKKNGFNTEDLKNEITKINLDVSKIDPLIRNEFSSSRDEIQKSSKDSRDELSNSIKNFSEQISKTINDLSNSQKGQLETFSNFLQNMTKNNEEKFEKLIRTNEEKQNEFKQQLSDSSKETKTELTNSLKSNEEKTILIVQNIAESSKSLNELLLNSAKENRTEMTNSLKSFEEKFSNNAKEFNELQRNKFNDLLLKQEQTKTDTENKLDKIRETVEQKLQILQEDNNKKLEEMRVTVDEKLQTTLEKRFNDSFTLISDRLELVHKGLGEMQTLAISVGDIKKVMTNVKSRGIMGEYQLANILEDLLTNEQYEKNVKTKVGSGVVVEFAIKLPNNNSLDKTLWLPIDSKFPKEDYENLVDAYDDGDPIKLETLRKAFKNSIIKNAKDINEKYIDPPHTTEYGIMFLPFESLYAEVLRTPGLFELLQKNYKITITGPTTLSALLNSLQMGFRTLAIEKRSSEVWDILGVVKTEFGKFGTVLEKTKKKLQEATNTIDNASVRTRAIERQLKNVQELPTSERQLKIESDISEDAIDLEDEVENLLFNETDIK